MLPIQQLQELIQGKKVAFIGAGVSHKRCIEQFVELGAQVTLCDQKKSLDDFGDYADTLRRLKVNLSLGEHYTDGFAGQDIIMRTPGYEYYKPALQAALKAGAMVTSEVELFFEFCPCEIVAVTGSDGKTTTTTLISKMFEAAGRKVFLGGNIGAALLPQLADVTSDAVAVVELSSFQLISMRRSPKVAVVTNVTPNHLDHHKDMQEYIDAKRNILLWQTPPCRAVLGFENDITRGMEKDCKGEQVWFTRLHETDRGAFLRESDDMLCYAENGVVTPILPRKEIQLRGLHNVENLLAACAAVWGRVPIEAMRQVGSTFTGVEHRIEPVRTLDGVTYYNDSIASSPTRTIAGLRSFDQKIIRVLCGIAGFEPQILLHSNEGDLIDDALRNNLGVCLVPANLIYRKNMRNLAILRSTDVELVRLLSVAKRRDRIFQANAARLYHYTIHYFQNLGQELDEYFGNLLPEKQFSGRKSFGINNLKD